MNPDQRTAIHAFRAKLLDPHAPEPTRAHTLTADGDQPRPGQQHSPPGPDNHRLIPGEVCVQQLGRLSIEEDVMT